MKRNNAKRLLSLLAACCALILSLTGAAADTSSPIANISGSADAKMEFYVYAQADTTLVISQDKGILRRQNGMRNTVYGAYDITYGNPGQPTYVQRAALEKGSVSLNLARGNYYRITVTPYTMDRLTQRDAYLGYPGSYSSWQSAPSWSVTSADSCQLSLYPMGATAAPVITAVPAQQAKATVYVYYRLLDGSLITYETQTLSPGTHVITSKVNGSYFSLIGSPYQAVTVNAFGKAEPESITFYFQSGSSYPVSTPVPTATPTPVPTPTPTRVPTAALRIEYRLTTGILLTSEVRSLTPGLHTITYDDRFSDVPSLSFAGPMMHYVTVYSNGTLSDSTVVFYFALQQAAYVTPEPTPWYITPAPWYAYITATPWVIPSTPTPLPNDRSWEKETDQKAIIGAQKIFPRPYPGKGKNEFNYESPGTEITVHSKALSLQNDGNWWVCISGTVRDGGKLYDLDHVWIRVDYLNQKSFDINKVPVDPDYR